MATKSYTLNMAGSGQCDEFFADSDSAAERIARDMLADRGYGTPVFNDDWEPALADDDGGQQKRLLVWASEEDAENDDGANAIAEIETAAK